MTDKPPILMRPSFSEEQICDACGKPIPNGGIMLAFDYNFFCNEKCGLSRFHKEAESKLDKNSYMLGYLNGIEHRKKFKDRH